jgi:glycerol-3-phosphate dehydrogenase (NAD(P)+)
MTHRKTFGVIGAGAWGTALALVAARAGNDVVLWARTPETAARMATDRENAARLAGVPFDPAIRTTALAKDLATADVWLLALPAQALRQALAAFAPHARPGLPVVITAKGIERGTNQLLTDVLAEVLPQVEPLVLSGPSFAIDVARGLPTAVTLAARTLDTARPIAEALGTTAFRPYISDDLAGVQIGGAIKNVLAIAAGIVVGRELGESARAATIARAFAELTRFARPFGARPGTLAGLSGLGDLVLSCASPQSRNFKLGLTIGRDGNLSGTAPGLTEGAFTADAAVEIADREGIDVPIMRAVADILNGKAATEAVIARLMQRPLKSEN